MKENRIDLIEVILKQEIGYPLTPEEELYLSKMDEDVKEMVHDLIVDKKSQTDIDLHIDKIMDSLEKLPVEQQKIIKMNYQNKINK